MHQRISKNIFVFLSLFILLVTVNNKKFSKIDFFKINTLKVFGLDDLEKKNLTLKLEKLKNQNIFFLDKNRLSQRIDAEKIIEEFSIFKRYPSSLIIKVKRTNFLAIIKKNDTDFYISSNGNLIYAKEHQMSLPYIFGNININQFLEFKKIIDNSKFNYDEIKKIYHYKSKRWDLETKSGLIIKLPSKDLEKSFSLLFKLMQKDEFKNIKVIDLRQKNQIIINE